ncbi:MAG: NAD(P)H-dependent oxidoreductase [Tissierellia bacterium]|nr:NAD(P)H-dependent oxidoreductase [Tissierellia bacterium]
MNLLVVVGSVSNKSNNKKVANYIMNQYKDQYNFSTIDLLNVPIYNEDIETNPPAEVKEFITKIKEADGVIIVTPEYNHSIPGVLKNWLDWASRSGGVLTKKPVMIMGASSGNFGTIRAQMHLKQILASPGVKADLFTGKEIYIMTVQNLFDENNVLTDEKTAGRLEKAITAFAEYIESKK